MIVSSILTDLIFKRNLRRRTALSGPTIESVKQPISSNVFPIQNRLNTIRTWSININFLSWIFRIQDKINIPNHKVHWSKSPVQTFMNKTASNSNVESTFECWKHSLQTHPIMNQKKKTIQLRNCYENWIMKELPINWALGLGTIAVFKQRSDTIDAAPFAWICTKLTLTCPLLWQPRAGTAALVCGPRISCINIEGFGVDIDSNSQCPFYRLHWVTERLSYLKSYIQRQQSLLWPSDPEQLPTWSFCPCLLGVIISLICK